MKLGFERFSLDPSQGSIRASSFDPDAPRLEQDLFGALAVP
jgi:hypothetical protein